MEHVFKLPDLGEGLKDAEIVTWHVGVGDHIVTGQPLVSIETDKAVVEVPSPQSGYIHNLHGDPGDIISVGDVLVEFTQDEQPDTGAIVGDITPLKEPKVAATAHDPKPRTQASPAVRQRAKLLEVDLSVIQGSGLDGNVTLADVEAAAQSTIHGAERIRGIRRTMLINMTRAGKDVVPATITAEADIDAWVEDEDITIRLILAIVNGCRAEPALNAWLDAARESRTLHERVDIGIAMETSDGLFTPVIRDAGGSQTTELRQQLENLKNQVQTRSIPREALLGQSISLSNFGMFGGRFASLVVMPPQVAILGAGRAEHRPVSRAGSIMTRRILPLSLSFDHRAVTGIEAARFIGAVVDSLQGKQTEVTEITQ